MNDSTGTDDKPLQGAELAAEAAFLSRWGMSDREVADRLGVKVETLRTARRRARKAQAA